MSLRIRPSDRPRWRVAARRVPWLLAAALMLGCGGGDDFDTAQVPVITVTPVVALPIVRFSWTPEGAQLLRVYKGASAGSGLGPTLVWSISGSATNSLVSGIEYGTNPPPGGTTEVPAQPLELGQPYTVQVSRVDPTGANGGFTATGPRYVSTQTFTIASIVPGT
ncbi:MAG: hypothetical protein IT355_02050 [Gemmatimonadaceae bacterium]|nr:hypothetical protein [Gemmatimonadaceae bacterium]